jgi:hypothetical protein
VGPIAIGLIPIGAEPFRPRPHVVLPRMPADPPAASDNDPQRAEAVVPATVVATTGVPQ